MNYDHPKLTFVYPTFAREGMSANGPFIPDIGWQAGQFPEKIMLYVSIGLMLNSKKQYSFEIDILFDGASITPENAQEIDSKLINTGVSNRDDFVSISTNLIKDVVLPGAGLYTIKANLYAGKADSLEKELIDECSSYFTVAEHWMSTEMKRTN